MTVVDDNYIPIGQYVVKVFGQKHIKQYNPTKKEVFANILAQEFDLSVPQAALILVKQPLINELNENPNYQNIELKAGVYYGSRLINNHTAYTKDLKASYFDKDIMEQVFAFDVLIRNFDRRRGKEGNNEKVEIGKPNVLLKDKEVYLIDHDLSLDIRKTYIEYKAIDSYRNVIDGVKGQHIFLPHLKKLNESNNFTFDWFIESLRLLDFAQLNSCNEQIDTLNKDPFEEPHNDFQPIVNYLEEIQKNSTDFQQLLKDLIA
ncbi:HipA family kinase [Aureispira anguillae]|nr:HipA family kinase [Aureispira anguillae]